MLKEFKLKDISNSISSGLTPNRSNPNFWENGEIFWLKTEQLGERYIYETSEKISLNALSKTSIKLNPIDTISIAMYGEGRTRGNVSILKSEMTTNQACCNIVLEKDKADPDFIYYFLKTQYENLRALSSGVRKNLNSNDIKEFRVLLPELLSDQQKIASILSAIDDKIELNNKINAELEGMAKLIYDYWFVQFDFPYDFGQGKPADETSNPKDSVAERSRMVAERSRSQPYKSSGGKMVWNKELKREVPEGWGSASLLDIAIFDNGLACQKFRPMEGENSYPVIKIREMRDGITPSTERASIKIPKKNLIDYGDILFSWSASLEVMQWTGGKGALNQHIFKVHSKKYPKSFYYMEVKSYLKHFKMIAELRKTTMGHITIDHLKQSRIVLPPFEIIKELDKLLEPIFEQQLVLDKQNQELSALRDWLLPMLMNGQVVIN